MDEDELVLPVLSIRCCELVVDLPDEYLAAFGSFMPPRITLEDAMKYIELPNINVSIWNEEPDDGV